MTRLLLISLLFPLLFTTCKNEDADSKENNIIVDINSGHLNLRKRPNLNSRIKAKLDNNEELGYTGEWTSSWIQVVKPGEEYLEKGIVGWVPHKYVIAPNFKSRFLGNLSDVLTDEDEGAGCFMSTVEGTVMSYSIINLNGKRTLLERKETQNFTIYYNKEISIKLFTLNSEDEGFGSYKCLAIINYKGEEEVIFAEFMCGC
jgi:hypothetical protein